MKKYTIRFTKWVGIAWIVLAILVGCVAPAAEETATVQPVTTTPTIIAVTSSPTVTLSPTLSPTAATETPTPDSSIPLCTFATGAASEVAGPSLDDYAFSEPRVVLTHTSAIGIAGWLPDEEQLLITRCIPQTNRQTIETFNTHTGELRLYAEQKSTGQAFWLPQSQVVAFVDWEYVDKAAGKTRRDLWISQGTEQTQRLVQGIPLSSMIIEPSGYLVLFTETASDLPEMSDAIHQFFPVLSMPIDPSQWQYSKYPVEVQPGYVPQQMSAARNPDGSQMVLYSQFWTFLLDTKTSQVCELNLGEYIAERMDVPPWALEAQWSPDGRYLAFITTDSLNAPLRRTKLTILDIETGELRTLSPGPDIELGRHYVTGMSWAPNSHYLAVLGIVRKTETGSEKAGIFIVDVDRGESHPILSNYEFGGGLWGSELAWNPSGSHLAVNCPTPDEGRLCIILVRPKGNQEEQP